MKLFLKATPNSRKSEIVCWENDPHAGKVLKIKIAAPPIEGKANKAIQIFLSDFFSIPKSRIRLLRGDTGRVKMFEIDEEETIILKSLEGIKEL